MGQKRADVLSVSPVLFSTIKICRSPRSERAKHTWTIDRLAQSGGLLRQQKKAFQKATAQNTAVLEKALGGLFALFCPLAYNRFLNKGKGKKGGARGGKRGKTSRRSCLFEGLPFFEPLHTIEKNTRFVCVFFSELIRKCLHTIAKSPAF